METSASFEARSAPSLYPTKARDTRLDRTVASNVLPEHVASSPDLRQQFEREAQTISQLNHSHIC